MTSTQNETANHSTTLSQAIRKLEDLADKVRSDHLRSLDIKAGSAASVARLAATAEHLATVGVHPKRRPLD